MQQCEKLVVAHASQANDGTIHVDDVSHASIVEAAFEGFVAEQSAARIFEKLRCAAENDAEVWGLSLQAVVEHGEQFFVIVFATDAVGDFVEVDALVDEDEQSAVACFFGKSCEELDEVIPVVVVDDAADG